MSLSIDTRVQLLHDGLSDRVDSVRRACSEKLLPAWQQQSSSSMLLLLGNLGVELHEKDTAFVAHTLLSEAKISTGDTTFSASRVLPSEKVSEEQVR